jgi:hypothetical protein
VNLYYQTVPVFTHQLKNLAAILKLAVKDAKARSKEGQKIVTRQKQLTLIPSIRNQLSHPINGIDFAGIAAIILAATSLVLAARRVQKMPAAFSG